MTTINLRVEDSIVDVIKTVLSGFVEQKKVQIIDEEKSSFIVSSVEEVRKRVYEAEKRIDVNGGINEEEYEKRMNDFFTNELGISR